ncbi:MAG: hypothetical protein QF632_00480 [Candidatus Woesearchaeota archaeon]|jgi:DNA-binding CsgD family transcriptional regulator|nr:hypothetical protein [Candidatus Woesearchaeota archaeon]
MNTSFAKLAKKLNKSYQTVWQTYNHAQSKHPIKLRIKPSIIQIPITIFRKQCTTVLQSLVTYLREELQLSYKEIGAILKRNKQTVYTIHTRNQTKPLKTA